MDRTLRFDVGPTVVDTEGKLTRLAWLLGLFASACLGMVMASLWVDGTFSSHLQAQQRPYTTYPLKTVVQGPFGEVNVDRCLVVTAQGYALELEYPCPH